MKSIVCSAWMIMISLTLIEVHGSMITTTPEMTKRPLDLRQNEEEYDSYRSSALFRDFETFSDHSSENLRSIRDDWASRRDIDTRFDPKDLIKIEPPAFRPLEIEPISLSDDFHLNTDIGALVVMKAPAVPASDEVLSYIVGSLPDDVEILGKVFQYAKDIYHHYAKTEFTVRCDDVDFERLKALINTTNTTAKWSNSSKGIQKMLEMLQGLQPLLLSSANAAIEAKKATEREADPNVWHGEDDAQV
ncbi:hypothetical protein FACS1894122_01410 [Alphaproteobacteria bacterium]|nr:hypothetical protein FACS1894122_01410 [Alphaproteobacteria bacterium]